MKVAIIDLDGVTVDSTARFSRAKREDGSIDWSIAFTPGLVRLDILIDGADQAIRRLDDMGWSVIFLTSRPESMEVATKQWLAQHELGCYELICKPKSKQFTKTTAWKAEEVKRIAEQARAFDASAIVMFIDDELENRRAVHGLTLGIICKDSLDEYKPTDQAMFL